MEHTDGDPVMDMTMLPTFGSDRDAQQQENGEGVTGRGLVEHRIGGLPSLPCAKGQV